MKKNTIRTKQALVGQKTGTWDKRTDKRDKENVVSVGDKWARAGRVGGSQSGSPEGWEEAAGEGLSRGILASVKAMDLPCSLYPQHVCHVFKFFSSNFVSFTSNISLLTEDANTQGLQPM